MMKPMQSTKEYDGNTLILIILTKSKRNQLKLYNDDGFYKTKPYEKDNLK